MAYYSEKETSNPFLPKLQEKWDDLVEFEGDSIIEKIVRGVSEFIVLCLLVLLLPVGVIISIYNSFYNLQKKAYDSIRYESDSHSQFANSVEYGIYLLLSLPFLLLLLPYWIFAAIVPWFAKHKVVTTILLLLILVIIYYKNEIYYQINYFLGMI